MLLRLYVNLKHMAGRCGRPFYTTPSLLPSLLGSSSLALLHVFIRNRLFKYMMSTTVYTRWYTSQHLQSLRSVALAARFGFAATESPTLLVHALFMIYHEKLSDLTYYIIIWYIHA